MTTPETIYLIGVLPVAVIVAIGQECKRRMSQDPTEREAVLAPGLDGIVCGIGWPLLAALLAAFCVIGAFALVGRVGARLLE